MHALNSLLFPATAGLLATLLPVPAAEPPSVPPTADTYRRLATEVDGVLQKDVLDKFFPATEDKAGGGFYENFGVDWTRGRDTTTRSIVYQSRLTWLAAEAAVHDPGQAATYTALSNEGVAELAKLQWDQTNGGFYWTVNVSGTPSNPQKHAYGNAFAIYAAAVNYSVSHDPAALELAKKGFAWLDAHSHDATNGGYIEALTVTGAPMAGANANGRGRGGSDAIGTPLGEKSMNSHIHILEGLTALLEVWPNPLVRQRVQEVYDLSLDKIYSDPGYLNMFFNADWSVVPPRSGGDSYGHNIEAAYLLTDTARVLGDPDDKKVWAAARNLVDHALEKGWDQTNGGFYEEGNLTTPGYTKENKCWWVEAEGLYALLLMHERYGQETTKYWDAFLKTWSFITAHQLDHTHGGWYAYVTPDGSSPASSSLSLKTDQWTEGYHQGRALLNVSASLGRLSAQAEPANRPPHARQ